MHHNRIPSEIITLNQARNATHTMPLSITAHGALPPLAGTLYAWQEVKKLSTSFLLALNGNQFPSFLTFFAFGKLMKLANIRLLPCGQCPHTPFFSSYYSHLHTSSLLSTLNSPLFLPPLTINPNVVPEAHASLSLHSFHTSLPRHAHVYLH